MAHNMDIMPTCIDLGGASYPETYAGDTIRPMRGKSLFPLLLDKEKEAHEWLFWEHQGNRAVRKGDWKLVNKRQEKNWALYNIAKDRTEINDLSQEEPELVKEMMTAYLDWTEEVGVMPWGFNKEKSLKYRQ